MPADEAVLWDGESLRRGQCLRNGKFTFTLQDDGNMCLNYNGEYLWGTSTQDKDVQTATMQSNGNLCLRRSDNDFVWGSMQSGGNMVEPGSSPYLQLHDNGNIGIYKQHNGAGWVVWSSNTQLITFRAVHFRNMSRTVYTYPLIKDRDGSSTLWDGKASNIWAMVPQSTPGWSQIAIDWKNAYYNTDRKHYLRDEVKGVVKFGHNIRWGDDVWVNDWQFIYDENSTTSVHITSDASARSGNANYDGCSTNLWFDPRENHDLSLWTVDDSMEVHIFYRNSEWDGTIRKPDFNDIKR
ncbi:uncharacterized protein CLAFUR5_06447 [Fulvia fulva]|uniref:Bulb-type lectin domain-containing protein n=1 Tax=Passalora fulva TaxID=5499 RepID=A0A9Q8LI00_PASFU|nr:uncharacterized protein CLAFUR5_06447 [Fulvia fulva]UJO17772.1 hypothetical protein CLAFUR5_06447 [Fulvia fulva]WPV29464.1 hypothetical protein CLAFUW7_06301 [Fulvia fulva]